MWYTKNTEKKLDYSRPIIGTLYDSTYLLLPMIFSYGSGYAWFNVTSGEWDTIDPLPTPQEAVRIYEEGGFKISNAELSFKAV